MGCSRDRGKHPDEEEVIWYHSVHFGQPNALKTDPGEYLLVREREQEFPGDLGL